MRRVKAVFIGTSAGGVTALQTLFTALDEKFALPIVVVQHLPSDAQVDPALVFGRIANREILEACDKMPVEHGHIYFAPPGYHLLLERDFSFSLSQDEPVQFSRPSIDVLFQSAANVYGRAACGVILTGANADGADGLRAIQEAGGLTIVQDPVNADVSLMPSSAMAAVKPNFVGSLCDIAKFLSELRIAT